MLSAHFAIAATVSLYVGETYVVDTPNPSSSTGYIDNAAVLQSDKNYLSIDTSDPVNVKITVIKYFSNTAIVKIRFVEKYTYNGHINKVDHDVEVRITTKYPEITPNKETVTLSVGETKKMQYTVKPSGLLDPPITWGPLDYDYPSSLRVTVDENGNVTGKKAGYAYVVGIPYGNTELTMLYVINVTDLEKITLSASVESGYVYAGTKVTLTASIEGSDIYYTLDGTTPSASSKKYTSAGITINESCTLKAIAMKSGYKNSSVLTRNYKLKVDANSISIPSTKTIYVADSEQLNYTLQPSNSTSTVTWKSDNTSIATVSSSGLVKGIAEGKTTIRATTDNGKTASCEVTVKKVEATSISLPSSKTVYIGETVTLTYTMSPSNAMSSVTWKSADTSIATVSSSGVVTGKKEGSTNITVTTDNGKSASCRVSVEQKPIDPTKIKLSGNNHVEVGYSIKMSYTLEPENATTTITWKSDDTSIATVSSDGIVKGIKQGSTKITATTANGLTDYYWVYVGGFKNGTLFGGTSSDDYDVTYRVIDINAKTCEVYSCNKNVKKVVIPSSVMGYKVTVIRGFFGCKSLTSISIPNSVSSIEVDAFGYCDKLETITLPSSLTTIGKYAFRECRSLKSISIPNSVISIGSYAFYCCENMESATLSNSMTRIENSLFWDCKSLKNISGFNNVEYIGSWAFYNTPWLANLPEGENYIGKVLLEYKGKLPANTTIKVKDGCTQICSSAYSDQDGLVAVIIPSSLVNLDGSPFPGCYNLGSITVSTGNPVFDSRNNCNAIIKTKENELVVGCVGSTIPNSVKSIGYLAFYCAGLHEINIPDNIDSIAHSAYRGCSYVKKITIGKGLRTMGNYCFGSVTRANSITVSAANPYFDSRDNCNAIIETATNKLILGCNNTVIPNTVKIIGEEAFYQNDNISSLIIPNSVTTIEQNAFTFMRNLCSITIGKNVKDIAGYILWNYRNKLKSIRSLIDFPTDINKNAFQKYSNQEDSIYNHTILYIPRGSKANYQSAAGWKNFKHIVEIDDDEVFKGMVFTEKTIEGVELAYMVTDVDKKECGLVASNNDVKGKVTIPSSANGFTVRSIGEDVFYSFNNDRALTEVVIPNTIQTVGKQAFFYCEDMVATIPSSVTCLDDEAFDNCKKITADDLSNVTTFGRYALCSCEKIENIKLGSSVKIIGEWAFFGTGITNITIPKTVESIGKAVLGRCEKLQSIKVEEGNPYYDSRYNCNGIFVKATNTLLAGCMNTMIPEETETLEYEAFYYHSQMKEIKLPDNLKTIADYAFKGTGLSTITIPESVDSIGTSAFSECANLTSFKVKSKEPIRIKEDVFFINTDKVNTFSNATLYVPFGTKSLYASADVWKNFKNIVEMEQEKIERITVSQFLSKADTKTKYELTGVVKNISNTASGNFDLEQNGSKVYINGTIDKDGNAQKWGSLGVSEGDSIVLQGVYTTYNSAPAIKNAQYISHRRNMTVNLSDAGYATFYDSKNSFDLPMGLTAKVVTGVSDGKLEYRSLSDNVVPAGVAVMISGNANGGTYTLSQSLSEGRYSGSNMLYGSDETTMTSGDGYHYKLAYGHSGTSLSNVFGWYWGSDNGGAFKSEAHRAWMVVPKSSKTKSFSIDGETTEIVTIENDDTEGACYDLQGRRVMTPAKNGVYIMNGKTIIVK